MLLVYLLFCIGLKLSVAVLKNQEINLYQAKDCYLEHVLKQKAGNELHYKIDMASLHMNRQISVKPDTIK